MYWHSRYLDISDRTGSHPLQITHTGINYSNIFQIHGLLLCPIATELPWWQPRHNSYPPSTLRALSCEWFRYAILRRRQAPFLQKKKLIARVGDMHVRSLGSKEIERNLRKNVQVMGNAPHRGGPTSSLLPLRSCCLLM